MRYGRNLNIILKAVEKATQFVARDLMELENLQASPTSADRFANSCYKKTKEILTQDFLQFSKGSNLYFLDGEKIISDEKSKYSYNIFAIDGIDNLSRANPSFTIAVSLEHLNENNEKEPIAVAIHKVSSRETYYAEKSFGAFLNNHKIRVSRRNAALGHVIASENLDYVEKNYEKNKFLIRQLGSKSLEIAYAASAKIDLAIFNEKTFDFFKPLTLLITEAGGNVKKQDGKIIIGA